MKYFKAFCTFIILVCATSCTYNERTDEFELTWLFWLFLFVVIGGIIGGIVQSNKDKEEKQEREKKLEEAAKDYHVTAKVVGLNNRYQFIVDDLDKNIIYLKYGSEKKIIPFSKIMGVELIENNTMISSKSLGRTIGGALIGDLVAGGAGMIVGGLSGDSKQKKKVSSVTVVVKLRNLSETSFKISCFDIAVESKGQEKEAKTTDIVYGPMYKQGLEDAIKITELMNVIIDQIDNSKLDSQKEVNSMNSSIADELQKLAKLKEQGLISDEEFSTLKSKILK